MDPHKEVSQVDCYRIMAVSTIYCILVNNVVNRYQSLLCAWGPVNHPLNLDIRLTPNTRTRPGNTLLQFQTMMYFNPKLWKAQVVSCSWWGLIKMDQYRPVRSSGFFSFPAVTCWVHWGRVHSSRVFWGSLVNATDSSVTDMLGDKTLTVDNLWSQRERVCVCVCVCVGCCRSQDQRLPAWPKAAVSWTYFDARLLDSKVSGFLNSPVL